MENEKWTCELGDWDVVTEDKADFLLEQVKLNLKNILEAIDKLDNKAFIILGGMFTILSGLIGFISIQINLKLSIFTQNWYLLVPFLVLIFGVMASIELLIKGVTPGSIKPLGNCPKNLMTDDLLRQNIKIIKAFEAENYQIRINQAENLCDKKNKMITKSLNRIRIYAIFSIISVFAGLLWP
jgi:hypothetical protein